MTEADPSAMCGRKPVGEDGKVGYTSACAAMDVAEELRSLAPGEGAILNAADICCDRNADDKSHVALRYCNAEGERAEWTFADLKSHSERLAGLLVSLGV